MGGVALEGAGVDLDRGTASRINCSALSTWRKVQEFSPDHHSFTYRVSGVGVEGRIMDDKSSTKNADGSALEVVCGAPGHGRIIRKFLCAITHPLTPGAVLVSKVKSWTTRVPSWM
jgi:hypothetical protein